MSISAAFESFASSSRYSGGTRTGGLLRGTSGPTLERNHGPANAMRGPGLHQRAALRERRATPVRLLNGVTDRMRQRGFGDLACKLRLVPAPGPKRAAKSMRRDLDARADLLRESDHAGVRDWSTLRA